MLGFSLVGLFVVSIFSCVRCFVKAIKRAFFGFPEICNFLLPLVYSLQRFCYPFLYDFLNFFTSKYLETNTIFISNISVKKFFRFLFRNEPVCRKWLV